MTETLTTLDNGIPLVHEWGNRFEGWYLFKTVVRREPMFIGSKNFKYPFVICDYRYQFIMPSVLKFSDGMITYSEDERRFGVFRFPREQGGKFNVPIALNDANSFINLTEEQLQSLLKNREVLTFKAFSIPQYGFEFFSIEDDEFQALSEKCNKVFIADFKLRYQEEFNSRTEQVKRRILDGPDYLSILLDVLNLKEQDIEKVSLLTNNVIYRYR